jgi:MFS family permease
VNGDETYRRQLLEALRHKGVSAQRIGEVIAEVDGHVLETGEDARAAFGDPVEYADAITGPPADGESPRPHAAAWRTVALPLVAFAGGALGVGALTDLIGRRGPVLLHVAILLISVVTIAVVFHQAYRAYRSSVDPRTGRPLQVRASNAALIFCTVMVAAQVCIMVAM